MTNDFEVLHIQELLRNLVTTVEKIYPDMVLDAGIVSRIRHEQDIDDFDGCLELAIQYLKNHGLYGGVKG